MSYAGNPNGQNQLWSRWTFTIRELGRLVLRQDVEYNAARYVRKLFGTAGAICVRRGKGHGRWVIEATVEGVAAHDPMLVDHVRLAFQRDFVAKGWGPMSVGTVEARVLAGSLQNGKPAEQLVSIPHIRLA